MVFIPLQRQDQKRSDLDEQLKEYIAEWRKQRAKEEDDLKRLKDKQAKRKVNTSGERWWTVLNCFFVVGHSRWWREEDGWT